MKIRTKIFALLMSSVLILPMIFGLTTSAVTTVESYSDGGYTVFYSGSLTSYEKSWPVIVWGNGKYYSTDKYNTFFEEMVKCGYVIVAPDSTSNADGANLVSAIDFICDLDTDENSIFCGKIDINSIAAMGHVQGGQGAVNAANKDSRIKAVITVSGTVSISDAAALKVPTLFLACGSDLIVRASKWVKPAYDAATCPAVYACLNGAFNNAISKSPSSFVTYSSNWFNAWLLNDNESKQTFSANGSFSSDASWVDFTRKNMESLGVGSVFSDADIWTVVSLGEFIVIVSLVVALAVTSKKKKQPAKTV